MFECGQGQELGMGVYPSFIAGIVESDRRRQADKLQPGDVLTPIREPDNPHDADAVKLVSPTKLALGYIPRKHAGWVAERVDKGRDIKIEVAHVRREGWWRWKRVYVDIEIRTGADAS